MTPLDRLRLEKAAADCGFEMAAVTRQDGLELRSARFPERVVVRITDEHGFEVTATDPAILGHKEHGELRVTDIGELYTVLRATAAAARTKPNRIAVEFHSATTSMPKATEAERWAVRRVGQDLFRKALLDYWQGRCCVTGLELSDLLRASHIRPWAQCETDEQRLDVFNGLLLAPHLDALFDGGWVSFEDSGFLILSPQLPTDAISLLGISTDMRITRITDPHRKYLAYHRDHVYRSLMAHRSFV